MQVKVVDKVSGVVRYIQADARLYNNHLKAKQRNLDKRKQNTPGSESKVIVNIMAEDDVKQ